MAENLSKRPSKGILKTSSSFDNPEAPRWERRANWISIRSRKNRDSARETRRLSLSLSFYRRRRVPVSRAWSSGIYKLRIHAMDASTISARGENDRPAIFPFRDTDARYTASRRHHLGNATVRLRREIISVDYLFRRISFFFLIGTWLLSIHNFFEIQVKNVTCRRTI